MKLAGNFALLCLLAVSAINGAPVNETPIGRQGLLEIPKAIATIIRNTLTEGFDQAFTSPPTNPPALLQTMPVWSEITSRPRTTARPAQDALGQYQYVLNNFIITSPEPQRVAGVPIIVPEEGIFVTDIDNSNYKAPPPISAGEVDEYLNLLGGVKVPSTTKKVRFVRSTTAIPAAAPTTQESSEDVEESTAGGGDDDATTVEGEEEATTEVNEDVDTSDN